MLPVYCLSLVSHLASSCLLVDFTFLSLSLSLSLSSLLMLAFLFFLYLCNSLGFILCKGGCYDTRDTPVT